MSHPEQLGFFAAVADANAELVEQAAVIEIGAYDVNGSVRQLFGTARNYVGADICPGPGVDVVGYGHELDYPDGSFDLALSSECFEHDPYWAKTLAAMSRMVRPGGLVAFSCATGAFPEHGTLRTSVADNPGGPLGDPSYYRNLSQREIERAVPLSELFREHRFWYMPTTFGLYFAGVRAGAPARPVGRLPEDTAIEALAALMPLSHRLARLPLRFAYRLTGSRYQDFASAYWTRLARWQERWAGARFNRSGAAQEVGRPPNEELLPAGAVQPRERQ
jgi:SAM-dependent methyltransferase